MAAKKRAKKKPVPLTKLIPSFIPYKTGRPPKYDPLIIPLVKHLAGKLGYTEFQICGVLNISPRTIDAWKIEYPEFLRSLRLGKRISNKNVEVALYHRAIGYSRMVEHRTTETVPKLDATETTLAMPEHTKEVVTHTEHHFPPSEPAMRLWLTNRDEKRWKETKILQHTQKDGQPFETKDVTPAPPTRLLDAYLNRMARAAAGAHPGAHPDLGRDGRPGPGPAGPSAPRKG